MNSLHKIQIMLLEVERICQHQRIWMQHLKNKSSSSSTAAR
jgi:hypothetical protein